MDGMGAQLPMAFGYTCGFINPSILQQENRSTGVEAFPEALNKVETQSKAFSSLCLLTADPQPMPMLLGGQSW